MPGTPLTFGKRIGDLSKVALDIRALLGSQKDMLARAGLGFPPGVMDGLAQLRDTLEKLEPVVALHQTLLKDFLTRFWAYYDQLLEYRQHPTAQAASRLETEFDALFGASSGYAELDQRRASTRSHKAALLLVLKFPELPLHNNPAELGARGRVRKRDISFGPRTEEGKQAWDTFMTLAATTKKLKVSFYAYVRDRILKKNAIPPLSELIQKAAHELTLGQSYSLAHP